MGQTFKKVYSCVYRRRWRGRPYIQIPEPPTGPGVVWRKPGGRGASDKARFYVERTRGNFYRRITDRLTGEVLYFKRDDADLPKSPASKIDAEPKPARRPRLEVNFCAWFIDHRGRWFLVRLLERKGGRLVITPVTGLDAEREVEWPYSDSLEIRTYTEAYDRLKPLSARRL